MIPVYAYIGNILTACFYILIMHKFMAAFFSKPSKKPLRFALWTVYYLLQTTSVLSITISPLIMLVLNVMLVLIISSVSYVASIKRRCIFSILICAVWMLIETTIGIVLGLFGISKCELQTSGTAISLMVMFFLSAIAEHYAKRTEYKDISLRYTTAILIVPTGSIYLMHNIFLIASQHNEYAAFAIISSFLLLLLIYMIFEVYNRMVDDAEAKEKNLLYEHELDLLNKQAQEREKYNIEIRQLRHNIKNHMSSLLGMLQSNDTKQATEYVRDMLHETSDYRMGDVCRTGNTIVDNLINHKCKIARDEGIDFDANVFIPSELPFRNGHLTIIFGNLLDNAIEACQEVTEEKRYITLETSYEKEILMIVVINPYHGKRRKNHTGKYITTKKEQCCHGLGLSSVEKAVESYHGQIEADENDGVFRISVVMYGSS